MNMNKIDQIFNLQTKNAKIVRQTNYKDRIKKINSIIDWMYANRDHIKQALMEDFSKPGLETDIAEIWVTIDLAKDVVQNLKNHQVKVGH